MATKKSADPTATSPRSQVINRDPAQKVRVVLEVPQHIFALYEEQGAKFSREAEDEMVERLRRCVTYTALKPLYLDDDKRRQLEDALEHNISSAEVAIAQVISALSIQVGDVSVPISSQLSRRIASRTFRGETYEDVVRRETTKGLEVFAGMRPA